MSWSQIAWREITPIFDRIIEHPFLRGLTDGTLDRRKFLFYMEQDALYLADFSRALAGIAYKCPTRSQMADFLSFAKDSVDVELELHRAFLGPNGLAEAGKPSPTCLLYTSFMHRQLSLMPLEVAAATVLPCFWIYKAVGDHILALPRKSDNPYQSWIDTYGGDEYGQAVKRAVLLTDELAEAGADSLRQSMTEAFVLCSKMEWMFWDSAWNLEPWPV